MTVLEKLGKGGVKLAGEEKSTLANVLSDALKEGNVKVVKDVFTKAPEVTPFTIKAAPKGLEIPPSSGPVTKIDVT